MMSQLNSFFLWFFIHLFPCEGEKRVLNYQTPNWVTGRLGGKSVKMQCYQNYTQHGWMYWYQQKEAEGRLEQIGILMDGTPEPHMLEGFQDGRFIMRLETNKLWSLQITALRPEDAASLPNQGVNLLLVRRARKTGKKDHIFKRWFNHCVPTLKFTSEKELDSQSLPGGCVNTGQLYFGAGTKLTVVESEDEITPPNVIIFAPSTQELQEKQKITIVCLVTNFYPDHVNLTWTLDGKERTEGIKTEEPNLDNAIKKFSLTSRLRITKKEWEETQEFKCQVYFDPKKTIYNATIAGQVCDSSAAKDPYLRSTNLGELIYFLLILKSTLYGAFITGLMLRKKSMKEKVFT